MRALPADKRTTGREPLSWVACKMNRDADKLVDQGFKGSQRSAPSRLNLLPCQAQQ